MGFCPLTNYLERSLLPFRLLCYTDSELLSVERPVRRDTERCIEYFFPKKSRPRSPCSLSDPLDTLVRPRWTKFARTRRIVVIRSSPEAKDYRRFVRETWKRTIEPEIPVVFVSGRNETVDLDEEGAQFGDILQLDFMDTYQNLTLKMMGIYRFLLEETEAEQFIVINDDTIVNGTALRAISGMQLLTSGQRYILGKVSRGYPRLFMPWLPWHVSGDVYPHKCYPPFIQGSSFVISRSAAQAILTRICEFPFVHLDDIMTGIVTNCLGIRNVHREGFDTHNLEERFTVFHYHAISASL
ncbi:Protein BUS-17 [Aphelenchoides avenae]|nr:Protein BUS-17 [Aphelenchus avenae]